MRIQINGEPREIPDETTLEQLVSLLQLKPEQIAIELNRTVVRRVEWSATLLREDDTLEIVHFVGGGSVFVAIEAWNTPSLHDQQPTLAELITGGKTPRLV